MDLRRFAVPPDKAEAPEIEAQAAFYAWRRETKLPAFPAGQICRSDANSVFGRVECAQPDYPDGTSLSAIYNPDGSVQQVSGSRVYPAAYMYDYKGRKTNMTTWTNFAAGTGAAKTSWNYDPYRGWLTSKLDNNSYGPTYAYTAAGRLGSRTWARGITNTYSYNPAGDLATVNYSDGTPGITNIFDRLGRLNTNICNGITTTLFYDSANDPLGESYSGGVLDGLAVTNGYDSLLRRVNNSVLNGSTLLACVTNGFDAAGRLAGVSDGTDSAAYFYLSNSPLVDHIVFACGGTNVMTNQNTFDLLNRLTGTSSALNFNYQYNSANQRTQVTLLDDGSYWQYGYDALGQVTSGNKFFWDGTPYAGQQFGYTFDTIGNRTGTQTGGDQAGMNLRQASYTNNALNQIVHRGVPGDVDVMGLTMATNTVTVNGAAAYQKWEYFREQVAVNNATKALWTNMTVTATNPANQTTVSGSVFVAQNPETFSYDLDGNLTSDGRWTYTWDAENRLVSMTSLTNAPAASKYSLAFTYDYMGRRIQKVAWTNNGSVYTNPITNRFVYDAWNPVAILNPASSLVASLMWGTDLSGSMQGAGGVGGLLAENIASNGVQFVAYDGNGNVVALVSATNGTVTANYEYGPFGEVIRATGPLAKVNPFMFSTKYYDWETGLLYYGHRFYNPSTGRFINRDPIGERGGKNLYAFVRNQPISRVDRLGLQQSGGVNGPSGGGVIPTPGNPVGAPYSIQDKGWYYLANVTVTVTVAGQGSDGNGDTGDVGPFPIGTYWVPGGGDAGPNHPCKISYKCGVKCTCPFAALLGNSWTRQWAAAKDHYIYGSTYADPVMTGAGMQQTDDDGNYLWKNSGCSAYSDSVKAADGDCKASMPAGICNGTFTVVAH